MTAVVPSVGSTFNYSNFIIYQKIKSCTAAVGHNIMTAKDDFEVQRAVKYLNNVEDLVKNSVDLCFSRLNC